MPGELNRFINPHGRKYDARILLSLGLYLGAKLENKTIGRNLSSVVLPLSSNRRTYNKTIVIYLVHGFIDTDHCFIPLQEYLTQSLKMLCSRFGINITVRRAYFDGVFDPNNSVQDFAIKLLNIIRQNADDSKTLIMIGHSLGGCKIAYLAEYFAERYGLDIPVNICIASPFHGSRLANIEKKFTLPIGHSKSTFRQMHIDSPDFAQLRSKIKTNLEHGNRKYYFFAAERDWVVSRASAIVDERFGETISNCSHAGVLNTPHLHESITGIITNFFYSEEFLQEYSSDCTNLFP